MSNSVKSRFRTALDNGDLEELDQIYLDLFGADEAPQEEDPLFAKFKSFMLTVDETAPEPKSPKASKSSKVSKKKDKPAVELKVRDVDEPIPTKIQVPYKKGSRNAGEVKHNPVFPCSNLYDENIADAMAERKNPNKISREEYQPDIRACEGKNCKTKFDYNKEYPMGSTFFGGAGDANQHKILCQKCRDIK